MAETVNILGKHYEVEVTDKEVSDLIYNLTKVRIDVEIDKSDNYVVAKRSGFTISSVNLLLADLEFFIDSVLELVNSSGDIIEAIDNLAIMTESACDESEDDYYTIVGSEGFLLSVRNGKLAISRQIQGLEPAEIQKLESFAKWVYSHPDKTSILRTIDHNLISLSDIYNIITIDNNTYIKIGVESFDLYINLITGISAKDKELKNSLNAKFHLLNN